MSSPTIDEALRHHRLGDLRAAEAIYRRMLSNNPDHADALHLLGMLLNQTGRCDQAEASIRLAISIQPSQAVYHSNLGIVLSTKGDLAAAISEYRLAESLDPKSPETLNNLGVALHARGAAADAMDCFKRALLLRPAYADAQKNLLALLGLQPQSAAAFHALGDLLHEANQSQEAIRFYRRAIELDPNSAETHNNLGNALFASGDRNEALLRYQRAMELRPDFPQATNNLANVLKELERLDEAIVVYRKAVELQPGAPEPLSNLGNALRDIGQWQSAMDCYQHALAIQPDHAVTHNNIGNAWCERGNWPAAVASYETALAIKPDYADAINNLGTALEELGHRDRAMECYQRAKEIGPNLVSPPWNIALLQLLQGDYKNGWRGYENRWRQKKQSKTWRDFREPMLKEITELLGKRILLHAEQGFGDAIQFCRYATLVARQGASVILECPPKLARLFHSLDGVATIIPRGQPLPLFDLHCPLMSLPMLFGTEIKKGTGTVSNLIHSDTKTGTGTVFDLPATAPYLGAEETDIAHWRRRLADEPPAFRVGLVWAGQSTHQKDRHRSLSLAAFTELGEIPGVRFYSLQVGEASIQAKLPPAGMTLIDWTDDLDDFADTAALISQLDLVIAVDTAVCHLTGAMGKPVWILIAFQPDWRWLLDRDDSPWYPTARLFRQPTPEDWGPPLKRVKAALLQMLESRKSQQR